LIRGTSDCSGYSNDVLTYGHADRSQQKEVTSAEAFDHVKAGECGCHVDAVCDDLDDEGIVEPCVDEILCSVVSSSLAEAQRVDVR
jgi:hypothetical protein